MKKYSFVIISSVALLLAAVLVFVLSLRAERSLPLTDELSFVLSSEEGVDERINCWEDEDGELVVFLPSYAQMGALKMEAASKKNIRIDGTEISSGMDCSWLEPGSRYSITDGRNENMIRFLKSANAATMYIETESGSMDRVHADRLRKEYAGIQLFTESGVLDYQGSGLDQIRGHGNSTWYDDKKPYNLYLSGEADLLHMGLGPKWVLVSNAFDDSNIRNKAILDLADKVRSFDGFSPHSSYVDLYLNGEYVGLYLLTEHTSNFDNPEVLSEDGVLFYTDWEGEPDPDFYLNPGFLVKISLPDPITVRHRDELQQAVARMQEALLAEDPADKRWMEYIDIDSWARKYLIEEIFMNNDAGTTSQYYIWNDRENRFYAGPCWDYDDTMGDYLDRSPRSFLADREWEADGSYTPWFHALMQKPEFQEKVHTLYEEIFLPELKWLTETGLQQYSDTIRQAATLNGIRWYTDEMDKDTAWIKAYLTERIDFLKSAWIEGQVYHTITLKGMGSYRYFCIPDGEDGRSLPSTHSLPLPEGWDKIVGDTWYYEGTHEPFDPGVVLTQDITLFVETEDAPTVPEQSPFPVKPCVAAVTLLIMIAFASVMIRREFGGGPSGKRGREHGLQ